MAVLRRFTPLVEPISIDEAFLDVTGSRSCSATARRSAGGSRTGPRPTVDLTISVGVAQTKLVAKIASDLRKPDGLVVVPPGTEAAFLAPLRDPPAVGRRGEVRGDPPRVRGSDDRRPRGAARTTSSSGGSASTARRSAIGPAASTPTRSATGTRRSRSATSTRSTSTPPTAEVIERTLLGDERGRRRAGCATAACKASTITVKIRDTIVPDDHPAADAARADRPDRADLPDRPRARPARGPRPPDPAARRHRVAASASASSSSLFGADDPRRRRVVEAADAVRHRFGDRAITRARLVGSRLPAPFERDPMTPVDPRAHAQRRRRLDDRRRREEPDPSPTPTRSVTA